MAEGEAGWQITSVLHGAVNLGEVTGARVREEVETGEIRALDSVGPAANPIGACRLTAEVRTLNRNDYVARGTKASLVVAFKDADAGTGSITATNMVRTTQEWDQGTMREHDHSIQFVHEGDMATTPITIVI